MKQIAIEGSGSRKAWCAWTLLFLAALTPAIIGGVRLSAVASGGGGSTPNPPQYLPSAPTVATTPGDFLHLPLVVAVAGPAGSYTVAVTAASGAVVALGTTNAHGIVVLDLPSGFGLELDVVGTSVVGLPVHAGQSVSIVVP